MRNSVVFFTKLKQKHDSQFLGGKIQICCIARFFYSAVLPLGHLYRQMNLGKIDFLVDFLSSNKVVSNPRNFLIAHSKVHSCLTLNFSSMYLILKAIIYILYLYRKFCSRFKFQTGFSILCTVWTKDQRSKIHFYFFVFYEN